MTTYHVRIISGPLDADGEIEYESPEYREYVRPVDAQFLHGLLFKFHQLIMCTEDFPCEVQEIQKFLADGYNVLLIGTTRNQVKIGFDIDERLVTLQ